MLSLTLGIVTCLVSLALLFNLWRLLVGPALVDRLLALDTMFINSIALIVLLGLKTGTALYFEGRC